MGPVVNFFLALAVAGTSLAGGSLLWPRLTTNERPKLLQEVHDVVIKIPPGVEMANVLGVSDETHIQPLNVGELASSVAGGVKTAIQNRIQTIVVTNAVNQLMNQFDRLPKSEQQQIQEALCKPAPKPTP